MVFSVRDALLGVAVPSRFRQFQGVPSRVQRTRTHILFARLIHLLSAELIPPPPRPVIRSKALIGSDLEP